MEDTYSDVSKCPALVEIEKNNLEVCQFYMGSLANFKIKKFSSLKTLRGRLIFK
jgi:hypothetical protein